MILIFHIAIALSSVAFVTYSYFSPSSTKLKASYGLIGLTLATGTLLVLSTHASMLRACLTGLAYVCFLTLVVAGARRKLVAESSETSL